MERCSVVVLILDGCNIKALKRARTPHIDEIKKKGSFTFRCRSVYPTATYSAHASIVTGAYPNSHGIVGNSFYDMGRIIDLDVEDVNQYLNAKTIFEEVQGVKIAVGEPVCRGADIAISKEEVQARELFDQDVYAINKAMELIEERKPILAIVNLPGIDRISEVYGPLSKELLDHLEGVDRWIGILKRSLEEAYDDYFLIILSDHGMVEVEENIDLKELIGPDAVICTSHRMAHIYAREDLEEVRKRLRGERRLKLLSRDELADYNLNSPRSGDLVVIAKKRYELGPEPLKGSHGGDSRDEVLVPLIVSKPEYVDALKEVSVTDVSRMALRYLCEVKAMRLAKEVLRDADPAHRSDHTHRVLNMATKLAIKYDADVEAVRLSCIFHDLGRVGGIEGHEERSAWMARRFLTEEGRPKKLVDKVERIILKHHLDPDELELVEEKILWDADKLDSMGVMGLARCLLEEGFLKRGIDDAIEHLLRDLNEFKGAMHFVETEKLARSKEVNVLKFLKKLEEEG